ncbi:MAG TPA: hypothetical protein PK156_37190 [Polyangium sp.]|nr:hypothetical protein [Polyangium sp.]
MKAGLLATHLAVVVIAASVLAQAQQPAPNQAPEGSAQPSPTRQQSLTGLPPADQPVLRHIPRPVVSVEGGGGIVGFVGGAGKPGPGWNLRVTGAMSDRWAVEGNYLGSVNERSDTKDTLVMTGIDLGVRYNLALPDQLPVQPFVVGGAGYAGFAGRNGDPAMLVVPLVVGAERLLTPNIKVGARFSYRPAFFDDLSTPTTARGETPGADTWSVLAQIGGGF